MDISYWFRCFFRDYFEFLQYFIYINRSCVSLNLVRNREIYCKFDRKQDLYECERS